MRMVILGLIGMLGLYATTKYLEQGGISRFIEGILLFFFFGVLLAFAMADIINLVLEA